MEKMGIFVGRNAELEQFRKVLEDPKGQAKCERVVVEIFSLIWIAVLAFALIY